MRRLCVGVIFVGLMMSQTALAQTDNHAVLQAVAAIELTEEQKGPFGEVMQVFFADVRNGVRRELQKVNGRDKSRAIKKRIAEQFEELDTPVAEILRHDQWLAYLRYKKAIADHMRENGVVARR